MNDDRRQASRYPIRVPIDLGTATGVTRDLSLSGVYFETSRTMDVGSEIHFKCVLEHAGLGEPLVINCSGKIIRVTNLDESRIGIAAAIDELELAPSTDAPAMALATREGDES